MHHVPVEIVAAASLRIRNAIHVQQMMVAILKARLLLESQTNQAECPDRGSEMGDCMGIASDNKPPSVSDIGECMELDSLDDDFDLGTSILR